MLYRLFPHDPDAAPGEPGGALHTPRTSQGRGRHDDPARYGALYASAHEASVVAEFLWQRGFSELEARDLMSETGRAYAIASLDDSALTDVLDLDDPAVLIERRLRPSRVATRDRERTQALAIAAFEDGAAGLEWWSTIEASWINVTLFAERVLPLLSVAGEPESLTVDHPAVVEAAETVGVRLT